MKKYTKEKTTDFGAINIPFSKKQGLVNEIFDNVSKNYDLMNDLMSFGLHRFWKERLLDWMAPRPSQNLLDIAGGTGDVAIEFLKRGGQKVILLDINFKMMNEYKKKNIQYSNNKIFLLNADAEEIPLPSNSMDLISISFGLRNIPDKIKALNEIRRVLKTGGRFMCLEFSEVNSPFLKYFYQIWLQNFIPKIGKNISNDSYSYQYLVDSIKRFPNQEKLKSIISSSGFRSIKIRNLSGGIVAIHSAWKY